MKTSNQFRKFIKIRTMVKEDLWEKAERKFDEDVIILAKRILQKALKGKQRAILKNKRDESLIASALYIASGLRQKSITQEKVAKFFGICEMSIRNTYRFLV